MTLEEKIKASQNELKQLLNRDIKLEISNNMLLLKDISGDIYEENILSYIDKFSYSQVPNTIQLLTYRKIQNMKQKLKELEQEDFRIFLEAFLSLKTGEVKLETLEKMADKYLSSDNIRLLNDCFYEFDKMEEQ